MFEIFLVKVERKRLKENTSGISQGSVSLSIKKFFFLNMNWDPSCEKVSEREKRYQRERNGIRQSRERSWFHRKVRNLD